MLMPVPVRRVFVPSKRRHQQLWWLCWYDFVNDHGEMGKRFNRLVDVVVWRRRRTRRRRENSHDGFRAKKLLVEHLPGPFTPFIIC